MSFEQSIISAMMTAAVVILAIAAPAMAQQPAFSPVGGGQVRALVIGADEYDSAPSLKGAVADAVDFRATLRTLGVKDLTVLIGDDVTRSGVEDAMESLLARSLGGDLVIMTFAGHGAKERERVPGSEADGFDEIYLLPGFQPWGDATMERIYDKEINNWLRRFEDRGVDVLFVADVCYGGGLVRSVDPRADRRTYRSAGLIQLPTEDELAGIDLGALNQEADFERVTFLSAVDQDTLVPEVQIPGIPGWRGALSYAVARALEGGLQPDRNGDVSRRRLFEYARQIVYQYSQTRQTIRTEPTHSDDLLDSIAFRSRGTIESTARADAEPFRVRVLHGAGGAVSGVVSMRVPFRFVQEGPADLIWDVEAREVVSGAGDIVAQDVTESDLPAIVDRTGAVQTISRLAETNLQPIRLLPDDGHHRAGERVSFRAEGAAGKFLILFNIAYDGTIQFLFPLTDDQPRLSVDSFHLSLQVQEPFGADHVVAIVSDDRLLALERSLRDLAGQRVAGRLLDILPAALAGDASLRIGTAGLFTAPLSASEGD